MNNQFIIWYSCDCFDMWARKFMQSRKYCKYLKILRIFLLLLIIDNRDGMYGIYEHFIVWKYDNNCGEIFESLISLLFY